MSQKQTGPSVIRKILLIVWFTALVLLFGYGILTLTFSITEQNRIRQVQDTYKAVSVHVTEVQKTSTAIIVAVEPDDKKNREIGKTVSTTVNRSLQVGDALTMYCDPANPDNRVIDFGTAEPQTRMGGLLTGIACLAAVFTWILRRNARKKEKHSG